MLTGRVINPNERCVRVSVLMYLKVHTIYVPSKCNVWLQCIVLGSKVRGLLIFLAPCVLRLLAHIKRKYLFMHSPVQDTRRKRRDISIQLSILPCPFPQPNLTIHQTIQGTQETQLCSGLRFAQHAVSNGLEGKPDNWDVEDWNTGRQN